jgi:hypothetical protein
LFGVPTKHFFNKSCYYYTAPQQPTVSVVSLPPHKFARPHFILLLTARNYEAASGILVSFSGTTFSQKFREIWSNGSQAQIGTNIDRQTDGRTDGRAAWLSHKRHLFHFCKDRWLNGLTLGFLDARILVTRVTKGVKINVMSYQLNR